MDYFKWIVFVYVEIKSFVLFTNLCFICYHKPPKIKTVYDRAEKIKDNLDNSH